MCWKVRIVKTTIFFTFNQLLGALYLNLFLIDDPQCKLCNIWLLLCENNSRSVTIPKLNTGGELKGVTSFFQGEADTLEDTMVAIFSDVILVSNYHGCKEEAINLIPQYLIDIIHKLLKPSHLEKLQIIQNINKRCSKLSSHFLIEF